MMWFEKAMLLHLSRQFLIEIAEHEPSISTDPLIPSYILVKAPTTSNLFDHYDWTVVEEEGSVE